MLKYLKYQKLCDTAFGAFMFIWVASRHIVFPILIYSIYRDLPFYIQLGCYTGANNAIEGPSPVPDGFGYLLAPFRDPKGLNLSNRSHAGRLVRPVDLPSGDRLCLVLHDRTCCNESPSRRRGRRRKK